MAPAAPSVAEGPHTQPPGENGNPPHNVILTRFNSVLLTITCDFACYKADRVSDGYNGRGKDGNLTQKTIVPNSFQSRFHIYIEICM